MLCSGTSGRMASIEFHSWNLAIINFKKCVDELDAELMKSEHLLGEIIAATREKTPKVMTLAVSDIMKW